MPSRTFAIEDQHAFAALSGDCNPMHVDPVAARRFLYGEVVVHGIHLLLQGLEWLIAETPALARLTQIEADFRLPVQLGAELSYTLTATGPHSARVSASKAGSEAMRASIEWSPTPSSETAHIGRRPPTDALTAPREIDAPALVAEHGETPLWLDTDRLSALLPIVAARLPAEQTAALLASTRIVGMHCPGYHSVYSALSMRFDVESDTSRRGLVRYRVTDFDERFGLTTIDLDGAGLAATLKAFLRPAPQRQPGIDVVATHVTEREFAERRALVVGGSRGLGELVAKLLAAGGAEVALTYASGESDAARVASEIATAGFRARHLPYRAGDDDTAALAWLDEWAPTDLCYFATPVIHKTDHRAFVADNFAAFCDVYVNGFATLFERLAGSGQLRRVLYPSSVAIDENPKGMSEYSAAKAAGETLCDYLSKRHAKISITTPRLPRLATDQTASVLSPADAAPIEFFAGLLRA